jgi:hypothetical protein
MPLKHWIKKHPDFSFSRTKWQVNILKKLPLSIKKKSGILSEKNYGIRLKLQSFLIGIIVVRTEL